MLQPSSIKTHDSDLDEIYGTVFDTDYAAKHIILPKDPGDIPHIFGWAGPARSGTTGLLFLFAGHPAIAETYFQPLKTILRQGGPDFELKKGTNLICMKEVFRGCCRKYGHDPISMLLGAGVPPEKITWITMLRDPVQTYSSWTKHITSASPERFREAQRYAIDLYYKHLESGINIVPFAYDLLALGESKVLDALLKKANLEGLGKVSLDFDFDAIGKKMAYGQAKDAHYFETSVKATLERKRFVYSKNNTELPKDVAKRVRELCKADYDDFYKLSANVLGL
jgi:hypothetical protein